ncbi:glycosyltransferase family 4 protein [Thermophilibacter sp.]
MSHSIEETKGVVRCSTKRQNTAGKPLTIVFVADRPTTGGAALALVEVCAELRKRYGIKGYVCLPRHSKLEYKFRECGIEPVVTRHGRFLIPRSTYRLKRPIDMVSEAVRWVVGRLVAPVLAERTIDFDQVDAVYTNVPRNDLGVELAKRNRIPHIVHLREASFADFCCVSLRRDPGRYLSDGSCSLIAISQFVRDEWVLHGVTERKIHLLYDYVDTSRIVRKKLGELSGSGPAPGDADRKVRAVFLGGYGEAKGVEDILRAVALMKPSVRTHLEIDVFGAGFPFRAKRLLRRLHVGDAVNLGKYLPSPGTTLCGYDLGIACSRAEAFGRVIAEYRSAGLAVVARRSGAFPELIKDRVDGLLYDPGRSAESLCECLTALVEDVSFMRRLASSEGASHQSAEEYFRVLHERIVDVVGCEEGEVSHD